MTNKSATNEAKIKFIMLIAKAFHRYGASADRIEKALDTISNQLEVKGHYFSLPTGIFASFKFGDDEETRMERLDPGKVNLSKLFHVDQAVDYVTWDKLSLKDGTDLITSIMDEKPQYNNIVVTLSYCLISFAVCIILKGSWLDSFVSATLGLLVGVFAESVKEERIDSILEGISAFAVTLLALLAGTFYVSNTNIVILSSLIILVPGLMVTMAIGELSSQNLTSGTARLLGAAMILLKISFGVYLGSQVMKYVDLNITSINITIHPLYITVLMVALAGIGFTFAFQARRQDAHWILLAAFISYFSSTTFTLFLGPIAGALCAGSVIGACSNLFSRIKNRPALIFFLPAIILLVPGSVGFKGLNLLFENNMLEGFNTIFQMATIGIALVSGTFFGSLLVKPKRAL